MARRDRLIDRWDDEAATYEQKMAPLERRFLADSRRWACKGATGSTLEVGVGTGLNLPLYDDAVRLTGVDWSPRMVRAAQAAAVRLGRPAILREGDAMALPFADAEFDTVVCTYSLCCVPDERVALGEAVRVLRPGGSLLLADHVAASNVAVRALEHLLDLITVPLQGEHYTRRPLLTIRRLDLEVVETQRLSHGAIERVWARRPAVG